VKVTTQHLQDINDFLAASLFPGTSHGWESHFLHGAMGDYTLYGTGPTQLVYLGATKAADAALKKGEKVTADGVEANRKTFSWNKKNEPKVSNFWIQFDNLKVHGSEEAGITGKPIRLAGQLGLTDSSKFFERFESSVFGLSNATEEELIRGIAKHYKFYDLHKNNEEFVQNYLRQYAIRRACKFLMYDTPHPIRYALDGLNLEWVAKKIRLAKDGTQNAITGKLPICTTELRELFRCWDYFQSRVTFYKSFWTVMPPWSDPMASHAEREAWATYADRQARKILASLSPFARINSAWTEVNSAFEKNDYSGTIQRYHQMAPSRWGKTGPFHINNAQSENY
jgi:hypothetical protein